MSQGFEKVERQRNRMAILGGIVMAAMCAALILMSWNGESPSWNLERRWPTLVGLVGLVLLFMLYNHYRFRQLAQLESQLREMAVREASLQGKKLLFGMTEMPFTQYSAVAISGSGKHFGNIFFGSVYTKLTPWWNDGFA